MHTVRTALGALTMTIALTGCASLAGQPGTRPAGVEGHAGGGHPADSGTIAGAPELALEASSFRFSAPELRIEAGKPVTIVLTSTDVRHDLVVEGLDFHVVADGTKTSRAGLRMDRPGTYTAYCSVPGHRGAGMELEVVVAAS